MQLPLLSIGAEPSQDAEQYVEPRPDRLPDQDVRGRGRMQHLLDHQSMLPTVWVVQGQHPGDEVSDERAQLLGRLSRLLLKSLPDLDPAAMRLQDSLDVELLLVPEVII